MNAQTNERLTLTPEEAAKQLGVSMPTMYQLCNKKGFPSVRVGRKIIIPLASLEKWLEAQATERSGA